MSTRSSLSGAHSGAAAEPARERANPGRGDFWLDPNNPSETAEPLLDATSSKNGPLGRSHDQNVSPCASSSRIHPLHPLGFRSIQCLVLGCACALGCSLQNSCTFLLKNRPPEAEILRKKEKNLARIMLFSNHYILWLLKKFPQYGDFF